MLNCRLVVDVGSDFDSLNFAPFRLPQIWHGYSSQGLGPSSEILFDSKPVVKQTLCSTLAGSDLRDINTEA